MKLVLSSLLAMVVVVKSKLVVEYIRTKAVGLNTRPATLTASQITRNQSVLSCARKCTQNPACLSFLHGNDECELFDARVHPWETKSVKDALGFNYYYMMQRCSSCPDQRPNQEEYRNLSGRHVAFKTCSTQLDIYSAMVACACQRGRLVAIVDQETHNAFKDLIDQKKLGDRVWIGLSGICKGNYKEYNLKRSDGKVFTYATTDVYKNWASDNPNYNKEVGITMESGVWKDREYGDKYPYICEFP